MRKPLLGLLAALLLSAPAAAEPEIVQFQSLHRDKAMLRGFLQMPAATGPYPTILLLHGCSGPVTSKGKIAGRERAWMERLAEEGYVVLLLDSFNPRGFREICTVRNRPITEHDRPYDAYAALRWLRTQPYVRADRVAVMGWSHGAMTTLSAISRAKVEEIGWRDPGFVTAVAFYPGCLDLTKRAYHATVPLLMQLGEKDDWTPARHCQRLVERMRKQSEPVALDTYAGAYHGFDNPTGKVRTRSTSNTGGTRTVHVGRDPQAAKMSAVRTLAWLAAALKGDAMR